MKSLPNRVCDTDEEIPVRENPQLSNAIVAELLALAADHAKQPLQKALRRASRRAFLWPEEASQLVLDGRSFEELPAIGPSLNKIISRWIENPPEITQPPEIRRNFFTATQAGKIIEEHPSWLSNVRGDLQMHTQWSDGTGPIEEMAEAGGERGYEYIAITDHSKGLKIAGGINEDQLEQQGIEIAHVNASLRERGRTIRILRSIEINLDPRERETWTGPHFRDWISCWVAFTPLSAERKTKPIVISRLSVILQFTSWATPGGVFTTTVWG